LSGCRGGDAIEILAAATRFFAPRGIKARKGVSRLEMAGLLRVAFPLEEFEEDEMFWLMKQWEYRNRDYPLLAEWRVRDPLGVVWDQRYWKRDLQRIAKLLGRNMRCLAAYKMDLDNFKEVNESLGHSLGDEAIQLYCRTVRDILGDIGEVYRRGGDEVVALVPGIGVKKARALAEKVRAEVEATLRDWGAAHDLAPAPTASIGLVVVRGNRAAEDIVRLMDDAQKQAKRGGKNRVVCSAC
jgi:diguanylate cyclase (GGDEF)-like protein